MWEEWWVKHDLDDKICLCLNLFYHSSLIWLIILLTSIILDICLTSWVETSHTTRRKFFTLKVTLSESWSCCNIKQGCKFNENQRIDSRHDSRSIQVWESISLIELCTKCLNVYYIWFSQAATNLHPCQDCDVKYNYDRVKY